MDVQIIGGICRALVRHSAFGIMCVIMCAAISLPAVSAPQKTLVVQNDRGGSVRVRLSEITRINSEGQRVEIHAGECLSSCTMYLGVDNLCVSPRARFGFHGPSHYGQPLQPADFEHWSHVIAAHYRPTLRRWFMEDARFTTKGYRRLSGAELIRLGYPSC